MLHVFAQQVVVGPLRGRHQDLGQPLAHEPDLRRADGPFHGQDVSLLHVRDALGGHEQDLVLPDAEDGQEPRQPGRCALREQYPALAQVSAAQGHVEPASDLADGVEIVAVVLDRGAGDDVSAWEFVPQGAVRVVDDLRLRDAESRGELLPVAKQEMVVIPCPLGKGHDPGQHVQPMNLGRDQRRRSQGVFEVYSLAAGAVAQRALGLHDLAVDRDHLRTDVRAPAVKLRVVGRGDEPQGFPPGIALRQQFLDRLMVSGFQQRIQLQFAQRWRGEIPRPCLADGFQGLGVLADGVQAPCQQKKGLRAQASGLDGRIRQEDDKAPVLVDVLGNALVEPDAVAFEPAVLPDPFALLQVVQQADLLAEHLGDAEEVLAADGDLAGEIAVRNFRHVHSATPSTELSTGGMNPAYSPYRPSYKVPSWA